MRMRRFFLKYAPPGYPVKGELIAVLCVLAFVLWYSLTAWGDYRIQYEALKEMAGNWKIVPEYTYMGEFRELFAGHFTGFWVAAAGMLLPVIFRYLYFYQDGRCIYVMRRLPRRELYLRCLLIPLCGAAAILVVMAALAVLYFVIYRAVTPGIYLAPGQWSNFWEVLI